MTGTRYTQSYGSNDSEDNTSSDNDYEDEDRADLKMSLRTAINGELQRLGQYTHDQYGTSLIVNIDDVDVLDGIVMEKSDKEESYKLFSWDEFGFERDEDGVIQVSEEQAPGRQKIDVGGTSHVYEPVAYVAEGNPDFQDSFWLDDVVMWMGVSSKSRTFAEIVSVLGEQAVVQETWTDSHDWLHEDADELRPELQGKEIELFYKLNEYTTTNNEGDEVERSYKQAVVIDQESGEPVEKLEEPQVDVDGTSDVGNEAPDELPPEAHPVLDFYRDSIEQDMDVPKDSIRSMLEDSLPNTENPDEYVDVIIEQAEGQTA
jgi:hypothetical protein